MLSRCALFLSLYFLTTPLLSVEARLRVGIVRPMSGPMKPLGDEMMRGINLAFEKALSADKKSGHKIQLIEVDDQGRSSVASQVTEQLISQKKVHLIIASVSNNINHAIADVASRKNRLVILPVGTDGNIMAKGNTVFSISLSERQQGEVLGQFASQNLKKTEAVVMQESESPYAENLSSAFSSSFKSSGGASVETLVFESADQVGQKDLKAYKGKLVFIPSFYFDAKKIINSFKKQNVKATFLGSDGWDTANLKEAFGPNLSGHYFYSPYSAIDPHPAMRKFVQTFQDKFGKQPSTIAFAGYESFNLAMFTYKKVQSTRTMPMQKFLTRTSKLPSLAGPFKMNSSRSPEKPATIMVTDKQSAKFMTRVSP